MQSGEAKPRIWPHLYAVLDSFYAKGGTMNEEVKDLLQTALDALDEILGMDEDKVSGDLWDEVNDAYHKVEDIIE